MAYDDVVVEKSKGSGSGKVNGSGKVSAVDILKDFERSVRYWKPLHKNIESDFEFALGHQWEDADVETLRQAGVKALTINKIKPIIKLITGIERQSKSDFVAFPEGQEDGLVADIVTALLKNVVKQSKAERKMSEQFKRGSICGVDYLEPYIDYTHDMINGELRLRNVNPLCIFPDPDAQEYDLSDGKFLIKFSYNLTKDQLIELYPTKESRIEKLDSGGGKVNIDELARDIKHVQGLDYPSLSKAKDMPEEMEEYGYDLIEYQYKSWVDKYYIIDKVAGVVKDMGKEDAQAYIEQYPDAKLIKKKVPEYRIAAYVCGEVISDEVLWSFPKWKGFLIIPYFAEFITMKMERRELMIQGIVRQLRDLQEEYNKRRTQELRHLNSTVGSGMMAADDALSPQEEEKIKKYGSSPGVFIKYRAGTSGKPERILPPPLSQAHAQLAVENAQDLKEASGVNPDLLANTETDQSGRAILLKQKQGLVMIQEYLDNYSDTKKILGKFLLSQVSEVYTIETAIRVVGEGFLKKYQEFQKPVMRPAETEDMAMGMADENGMVPSVNPQTGQIDTEIDREMVNKVFNAVLMDDELSKYDVTIGEGAYSETVKISNYMTLADMVSKGIPIPPDILIEESMLPQGTKQRIVASIEEAQMMAAQAAKAQPPMADNAQKEDSYAGR